MRILIYNIRDVGHPSSGGAERFTFQVARVLARQGDDVVWFCSEYPGCERKQVLDGVTIVRKGNFASVFMDAREFYRSLRGEAPDVVIDEYTYRPFMAHRFVKCPVVFLVHELALEKWFYETPFPLSVVGRYLLEPSWLRSYKSVATATVSESTSADLEQRGFRNISIVPEGTDMPRLSSIARKEDTPTLLFVGLMKNSNLPEDAVKAFIRVKARIPEAQLWVVGRGRMLPGLRRKYESESVKFFGYVSESEKMDLMTRAHLLLVPAVREGWGLVVTEANARSTPAIGYNVPGLRDSIRRDTGILTERSPAALADAAIRCFRDPHELERLSIGALEWSRGFSWENTARELRRILMDEVVRWANKQNRR